MGAPRKIHKPGQNRTATKQMAYILPEYVRLFYCLTHPKTYTKPIQNGRFVQLFMCRYMSQKKPVAQIDNGVFMPFARAYPFVDLRQLRPPNRRAHQAAKPVLCFPCPSSAVYRARSVDNSVSARAARISANRRAACASSSLSSSLSIRAS